MKILVLNASPKGKNSTTVHTALYLQALHPEHEFTFIPVGQQIHFLRHKTAMKFYVFRKAGRRTRSAVRLPGGERISTGLRSRFGRCLTVWHRHVFFTLEDSFRIPMNRKI